MKLSTIPNQIRFFKKNKKTNKKNKKTTTLRKGREFFLIIRQDNTIYKLSIKSSFSSIGQGKSQTTETNKVSYGNLTKMT